MNPAESAFVTIVSSDGVRFQVTREAACSSATLASMLGETGAEIFLPDIPAHSLVTVFRFAYQKMSSNVESASVPNPSQASRFAFSPPAQAAGAAPFEVPATRLGSLIRAADFLQI
ncbi:hypothetical protein H696_02725 [Fonticula alba]|uniref:SKP1 component POZ domain-containing protein n=1 Tax=Fonticula alba TaxID=691883 RepID=A0A058Z7W7_FONAL|nr:hypothetical protein H696_02725 [Fonticula alba]KCV70389.1 hypothetical protein H696_02725 [Fonticula alba]|eukprot:XP_009494905.1 hypothetical protein H696_02725 [Fonticula alba]